MLSISTAKLSVPIFYTPYIFPSKITNILVFLYLFWKILKLWFNTTQIQGLPIF